MSIEIRNVTKQFGEHVVLRDVNLNVPSGKLVALLGPSGSGKTTLLRIIAGLETADVGQVRFWGEDATDRHARERNVGYVFQHYALFRHMTVFENVAFGLRVRPRITRPSETVIRRRVQELLDLVQLGALRDRFPSQLSGGQRQRVALARALAVEPKVLLLDEPFGALDALVRKDLRRWLRRLHDELNVTSILVTHDQEEALEVADTVVIMHQGRVEQQGTPDHVYERPATPFVLGFLGSVNLFHGRVADGRLRIGSADLEAPEYFSPDEQSALAYIRSHEIELSASPGVRGAIPAVIRHVRTLGHVVRLELHERETGQLIEAEVPRARFGELEVGTGDQVYVAPRRVRVFGQRSRSSLTSNV